LPLELPDPDRRQLQRSPLQLVVCQVRFEPAPRAAESRVAFRLQERFGGQDGLFPRIEPIQNLTLSSGPAGPVTATTGWRMTSAGRDWTLVLHPDQAALETSVYETWDVFSERLFELIDAVSELLEPSSFTRLGLRYIDHITEPVVESPAEWQQFISPEVLGILLHERLGPGVMATQQQVDFDAGGELRSTLRHGFFRDEDAGSRLTYVLDFDAYVEGFRAWDSEAIKGMTVSLNDLSLRLFQAAVTTRLLDYLRGEDSDVADS
jgi:uncharacterized protein (TIGR04255 family)